MADRTIQELFDLTGKTALITGGSGYLGTAMACALAEAGAQVIVGSRDLSRAEKAAGALPGEGHQGVVLDHMDSEKLNAGFEAALAVSGKVDVLINNGQNPIANDWTDVTHEQFSNQLGNASGYFELARCVRNAAVAGEYSASIVMLGSMYGQVASYPDAYEGVSVASPAAYHALKGGIIHLTRHLAVYWAKEGVRVNCLSPGPFPNAEKAPQKMVERLNKKSPMGRMGASWELKGAVVFLASDASTYMTGQNVTIDGGWTAW
ncbi:MAG: SDR family oxidoreductase [Candidatus Latescibacteria bacterium]|nr:SDR family oxidoreductase [Candidatus Latescibacterota bacterium]MBT4139192.1 SDR family oxidoreductase [Candidatus Latescibacterota bacterium]